MATASGRLSVALAAFAAAVLASSSAAFAETKPGRAVIRGTGSEITIVYETPRSATEVRASIVEDPLAQALRRKTDGEDDAAIIAFLRMHQASLPEVIDSEIVRDFRREGAGPSVISVLLSFAAVDIGETAEGGPVRELPPPQAADTGAYPDLAGMGYPFYADGGFYGGGYGGDFGRFGRHFGKHGFRGRDGFSFRKPFFPKPHVSSGRSQRTRSALPAPRPRGFR
jgi:hypothetical protein